MKEGIRFSTIFAMTCRSFHKKKHDFSLGSRHFPNNQIWTSS